jgi:hypothetical protein
MGNIPQLPHDCNQPMPKLCECGCGSLAKKGNRFIRGHQTRLLTRQMNLKRHPDWDGVTPGKNNPLLPHAPRRGRQAGQPARTGQTAEQRFWSKVDKTSSPHGCWLWTAYRSKFGYGKFGLNGKAVSAHCLSYKWANGAIPAGMFVCHNCPGGDNPACVNPAHLWLGTQSDNNKDAERKRKLRLSE